MTKTNLLARARQNRLDALQTLRRRQANIFYLDEVRDQRARRGTTALFTTCRLRPALPAPQMVLDRAA